MNVLIGFEESQAVMSEFRKLGHNAYSCDLKPASGSYPEYHLQMDINEAITLKKWDFIGLHPTCTALTVTGNRTYAKGKPKHDERIAAIEWTIELWLRVCGLTDFAYMENPIGAMNNDPRLKKPQIIHPYYFGDEAQKTTCLWLHNLPYLYHNKTVNLFDAEVTHVYKGNNVVYDSVKGKKRAMSEWYYKTSSLPVHNGKRAEERSKTFPGIARAIATQWSEYILTKKAK